MTELELANKRLAQEKRLKEEDQRLENKKRIIGHVTNVATSVLGGATGIVGKAIPAFIKAAASGKGKGKNHPSWYNKNADLVRDAASLSYSTPLGSSSNFVNTKKGWISGAMRLLFAPVLPHSDSDSMVSREVLQAFKSQYAAIRKANSGARNYESVDLARYQLAIQSAIIVISEARRAYGLAKKFDPHNRFVGNMQYVTGWDFNDVRQNLAQFRERINYYQKVLASYALPDLNTVVQRQVWMTSNVFKDTALKRCRLYTFVPNGYYIIHNPEDENDTKLLEFKSLPSYSRTVQDFINAMDLCITGLLSDPYAALISGDIQKAYGDVTALEFGSLDIDYDVDFVYDESILNQINSIIMTGNTNYATQKVYDVYQSTLSGTGYTETVLSQQLPGKTYDTDAEWNIENETPIMLNLKSENPTPDDNMVASRLSVAMRPIISNGKKVFGVKSCGTEIILSAVICYYSLTTNQFTECTLGSTFEGFEDTIPASELSYIKMLSQFDWHPLYMYSSFSDYADGKFDSFIHNLDNFVYISSAELTRMHEVAATSLYNLLPMS